MARDDPRPVTVSDPEPGFEAELETTLPCPACSVELADDELFAALRVCPSCRRHFALSARERLGLLVDAGSFVETNAALVSVDPLTFHDRLPVPDRQAELRERVELPEAVVTGTARIGGVPGVVIALDRAYLGGSIGVLAGEKIVLAMEQALTRRLPLIALCSGGGVRTQSGMLSLVQLAKITSAASQLHRAGVPFIAVLTHPTTGGVYAGLANQADIILAEPGAHIGLRAATWDAGPGAGTNSAQFLLAHGLVDSVVDRGRLRDVVAALLGLVARRGARRAVGSGPAAPSSGLSAPVWEMAALARHPDRPTAIDYIHRLVDDFVELHGDRVAGDDPAVICGMGRFDGASVMIVAQERGRGDERVRRNEGRTAPAGYRKAGRALRLAGHLELPVLTLVDTPGAASDAVAEAGGIGVAISQTLSLMSILPVPIVSVILGEGGGAGAVALGIGDRILMQERAIYSATATGGALPFADPPRSEPVGVSPTLTARECHRLGVVDAIVPEPDGGAHADPDTAARLLRAAVAQALADLAGIGPRRLIDDRARRVRHFGQSTPEGREVTRHEMRELQELQRTLARSLTDLRERWEARSRPRPRLPWHLHRPDFVDLAGRWVTRRPSSEGDAESADKTEAVGTGVSGR